jgi:ABC-type branched-subunit amino acid transport system ATPase component
VGSTGAGKSTINFAKPFYEIDSGTICIDNENIENFRFTTQANRGMQDVFHLQTPFSKHYIE